MLSRIFLSLGVLAALFVAEPIPSKLNRRMLCFAFE
jgi:hypothetical protein